MNNKRTIEDFYKFKKNRAHSLYNEFYMKLYTTLFKFNITYDILKKKKHIYNVSNKYNVLENKINFHYPIIYNCINLPFRKNISYKDSLIEMENIVSFINILQNLIFEINKLLLK